MVLGRMGNLAPGEQWVDGSPCTCQCFLGFGGLWGWWVLGVYSGEELLSGEDVQGSWEDCAALMHTEWGAQEEMQTVEGGLKLSPLRSGVRVTPPSQFTAVVQRGFF